MMPTIRIDDEVYSWLQSQGRAFEDTPNSVLRRVAGLELIFDREAESETENMEGKRSPKRTGLTGRQLNELWRVGARHALFSQWGTFYNILVRFPGALFDQEGYLFFETEEDYLNCPGVKVGERTNVYEGISALPQYVKMKGKNLNLR